MNLLVLSMWTAIGICSDWRSRRLPNALTLGGMACALPYFVLCGQGPLGAAWLPSVLAGVAALLILLPPYAVRAMGAGDVKFFVAMGLLGGPAILVPTLLIGSMLAAGMAMGMLVWNQQMPLFVPVLHRCGVSIDAAPWTRLPFGVPLGAGFLCAIWGDYGGLL